MPVIAAALRRFLAAGRHFDRVALSGAGFRTHARRSTRTPAADRPCVVLLAGLGVSGRYLLPFAAELGKRFPTWVPDLAGYERTDGPPCALEMAELADVVVAWMDALGVRRAVLVGSSMGCQVAVEVAARHADRASGVVLQGPTTDRHARTVPRHLWRIALDGLREPPSLTALQLADWAGTGERRLVKTIRRTFAHRIEDRLPWVGCPALVVRGSRDPVVPQRWAEEVAAGLPRGAVHVVSGAAHAVAYGAPAVLADIVARFVLRDEAT